MSVIPRASVVPDSGGPFWLHRLELRNRDRAHWRSGTPAERTELAENRMSIVGADKPR